MSMRISQKEHVNIPYEVNKCKVNNERYQAFIKSCVKELKTKGETICFSKEQISQITQHIDLTKVCYDERNDCYFLFSKR